MSRPCLLQFPSTKNLPSQVWLTIECNNTVIYCEKCEPRGYFVSRLSMIVRVNVVQNRTVVVDSD